MNAVPRLPIYVRPADRDTVDSYIRRLAHTNHIPAADLRSRLSTAGSSGTSRVEKLAQATGRSLADLQRALTDTRCDVCRQPLRPRTVTGRPALWCSARCRLTARHRRIPLSRQGPLRHALHVAPCAHCGTVVARNHPFRWCSKPCRRAAYEARWSKNQCGHCGLQDPGLTYRGEETPVWCSRLCRDAADRERLRAHPASGPPQERGA